MTSEVTYRKVGRPITSWSAASIADRKVRADLLARGICTECRKRKARGKRRCRRCQKNSNENQRELREKRKLAGDCQQCGKPASFRARCPSCVQKRNAWVSRQPEHRAAEHRATKRREKRRAARWRRRGRCVLCGEWREPAGGRLCVKHRTQERALSRLAAEIAKAERLAEVAVFEAEFGKLSSKEAAELVGVCRVQILRLCRDGVIPYGQLGALRRMHLGDVLAYKAKRDAHPDRQRSPRKAER